MCVNSDCSLALAAGARHGIGIKFPGSWRACSHAMCDGDRQCIGNRPTEARPTPTGGARSYLLGIEWVYITWIAQKPDRTRENTLSC